MLRLPCRLRRMRLASYADRLVSLMVDAWATILRPSSILWRRMLTNCCSRSRTWSACGAGTTPREGGVGRLTPIRGGRTCRPGGCACAARPRWRTPPPCAAHPEVAFTKRVLCRLKQQAAYLHEVKGHRLEGVDVCLLCRDERCKRGRRGRGNGCGGALGAGLPAAVTCTSTPVQASTWGRLSRGSPCSRVGSRKAGGRMRHLPRLCSCSASQMGTSTGMFGRKGPYSPCVFPACAAHGAASAWCSMGTLVA